MQQPRKQTRHPRTHTPPQQPKKDTVLFPRFTRYDRPYRHDASFCLFPFDSLAVFPTSFTAASENEWRQFFDGIYAEDECQGQGGTPTTASPSSASNMSHRNSLSPQDDDGTPDELGWLDEYWMSSPPSTPDSYNDGALSIDTTTTTTTTNPQPTIVQ